MYTIPNCRIRLILACICHDGLFNIMTNACLMLYNNVNAITIVITRVYSAVLGSINKITGHVVLLAGNQHVGCEPCRCLRF